MWHLSDMWQCLLPLRAPFGTLAGWCLVSAQIAGGIAMMRPSSL